MFSYKLYLNDIYGCHIYITKFCQDLQKKRNFFFKRQEEAIAKTDTALKGFEETSKQLLSACSVR
jgi:predicted secreted protein